MEDVAAAVQDIGSRLTPVGMSIRDKVRATQDVTEELVYIPEWEVEVLVKSLTSRQRSSIVRQYLDDDGNVDFVGLDTALVVASCYDKDTGGLIFEPGDEDWLADKLAGVLQTLSAKVTELSGLGPKAVSNAGEGSSPTTTSA